MIKLTFSDGTIVTTNLTKEEYLKRYNRLDLLRVLTEGYDEGVGHSIYKKAVRAENKDTNFTGIIRLSSSEKDFLGYMLENRENPRDIECIKYFMRM